MNVLAQPVIESPIEGSLAAERFHALDALRAIAMLLGIYLHAAVPYMELRTPFWPKHLMDEHQFLGHDVAVFVIHAFRMELFFVMAGFFAHLLLARKGLREFVRHRAIRIGVPFIAGWGLMVLLLPLSVGWKPFAQRTPLFYLPAHLWFLYYLLLFYAISAVLALLFPRIGEPDGAGAIDRVAGAIVRSPLQSILLAVATLPLLLTMHTGVVDTPLAFYPIPRVAAYYGVFFAIGWMLHRQRSLLKSIERWRWISLALVLVLSLPLLALLETVMQEAGGVEEIAANTPKVIALRGIYAVYTWALVFGATGFVLRHFSGESRRMRYLADSAYWQYIMHLPLVLFLQWMLVKSPLPGPMKIVVILLVSVALLLATYHLFVRRTVIGQVLNGPRKAT